MNEQKKSTQPIFLKISALSEKLDRFTYCSDYEKQMHLTSEEFDEICHQLLKKAIKRRTLQNQMSDNMLIVSVTSYKNRINNKFIKLSLLSLLNQTILPAKICLYLAKTEFPNKSDVPSYIRELENVGLSIIFVNQLYSYKKIICPLIDFPNHIIVSADDDMFYGEFWLESLYLAFKADPSKIYCHTMHRITFDRNGICQYKNWLKAFKDEDGSFLNVPIGCGGIIYTKNLFNSDITKYDLASKLAPKADDLWIWAQANLKGTVIASCKNGYSKYPLHLFEFTNHTSLTDFNVENNGNDSQISNILNYYSNLKEKFNNVINNMTYLSKSIYWNLLLDNSLSNSGVTLLSQSPFFKFIINSNEYSISIQNKILHFTNQFIRNNYIEKILKRVVFAKQIQSFSNSIELCGIDDFCISNQKDALTYIKNSIIISASDTFKVESNNKNILYKNILSINNEKFYISKNKHIEHSFKIKNLFGYFKRYGIPENIVKISSCNIENFCKITKNAPDLIIFNLLNINFSNYLSSMKKFIEQNQPTFLFIFFEDITTITTLKAQLTILNSYEFYELKFSDIVVLIAF